MSRLDKVSWEPRLCLCGCKTPTLMVDRNRGNSHLPKGSYRVFASRECYYRYHERVGSGKTHCPYGHKLQLRKHSRAKKGTSLTCRVCNTLRSRAKKMGVSSDQLMEHWPPPLRCEICNRQPEASVLSTDELSEYGGLVYDHNHLMGEFRGWLCNGCNSGLGQFGDNPVIIARAYKYLKERGSYG